MNTSPTQSFHRYVINFGQMTLEEAERWPDLLSIIREKVKPERDKNNREQYRKYWWHFGEKRPALYDAIRDLPRCLVCAVVSKHLMFSFQPTDRVFSHKLFVCPLPSYSSFAVLQSRVHLAWTWLLSSTLEERLNYSASDCFENFPFPKPDPGAVIPELETIGQTLYDTRARYMVDTSQGLTQTYNKLKDPACDEPPVLELRRLHEELDRQVLHAYGWDDIVVPSYCPLTPADQKALESFEEEVIDRLFLLNAQRAEEERALGRQSKKSRSAEKGAIPSPAQKKVLLE